MKIQFSNKRIIHDAVTVWYEAGPEVDMVMDLKALTFRPGSLDAIYSFHVLDHFFPDEARKALVCWKMCLKPKGMLYLVVDDFELLTRSFISGDFPVDFFNDNFSHPMYFTRDNLLVYCIEAGFKPDSPTIWYGDIPDQFKKAKFELVFSIIND